MQDNKNRQIKKKVDCVYPLDGARWAADSLSLDAELICMQNEMLHRFVYGLNWRMDEKRKRGGNVQAAGGMCFSGRRTGAVRD